MVGLPGPKGDTGSACKVGMVCENGTDGPPGPKGDRGIQVSQCIQLFLRDKIQYLGRQRKYRSTRSTWSTR